MPPHCPYAPMTEVDVGLLDEEVEVEVFDVVVVDFEVVVVDFEVVVVVVVLVLFTVVVVDDIVDVGGAAPAISP